MVSRRVGGRVISATSARPLTVRMVPSSRRAASSSETYRGLPPVAATSAMSVWPGSAPTTSATSSTTSFSASCPSVRRRAPSPVQGLERPVQLLDAGQWPQTADQHQWELTQAPTQCRQGEQAGAVGPLQVVEADHERSAEGQRLHQVDEGIDRLELQAWVAIHGHGAPVARLGGQQGGDGGAASVRGRAGTGEGVGQDPERAGPLQLLGPPGDDLQPAGARGAGDPLPGRRRRRDRPAASAPS